MKFLIFLIKMGHRDFYKKAFMRCASSLEYTNSFSLSMQIKFRSINYEFMEYKSRIDVSLIN